MLCSVTAVSIKFTIDPDLLGRSSQYEQNTSNGKLACIWLVNKVIKKALSYKIGKNLLYVTSLVE